MSATHLIKLEYMTVCKWAKVNKQCSYDDVVNVAKIKFPQITEDFSLCDKDGILLECDIFEDYINLNENNLYFKIKSSVTPEAPSTPSTSERSESDWQEINIDDIPVIIPGTCTQVSPGNNLVEELRNVIKSNGGNNIFQEYERLQFLNSKFRKQLVNIVVAYMVDKLGNCITKENKIKFAKAIVTLFPKLKDPESVEGGYETFYNPTNSSGYLAWRLRTVVRQSESNIPKKKPKQSDTTEKEEPVSLENIDDDINFLKNASPQSQRDLIFEKSIATFQYRRAFEKDIIGNFPRFLDTVGLIHSEFQLLFPNSLIFNTEPYLNRITEIYKSEPNLNFSAIISDDETIPVWNRHTSCILMLIALLPPTAKGRKKGVKESILSAFDKVVIFQKTGTPLEEVLKEKKTKQPLIIALGPNRGAVEQYVINIDNHFITQKLSSFTDAFDLLFQCHFVFNLHYDTALESFYKFVQIFFYRIDIDSTILTPKMRELRAKLLNIDYKQD